MNIDNLLIVKQCVSIDSREQRHQLRNKFLSSGEKLASAIVISASHRRNFLFCHFSRYFDVIKSHPQNDINLHVEMMETANDVFLNKSKTFGIWTSN